MVSLSNTLKQTDHIGFFPTVWEKRILEKIRILSKAAALEKSRSDTAFLTNLVVTGILCNSRIVLEKILSKEIRESSRLKFSK